MSGGGHGEVARDRVVDGVEAGRAEFGDLVGGVVRREVGDQVVEVGEEFVGRQVHVGEGADGRAEAAHGRRGRDAVSDDVADDQADPAAGERDHVEPVAADAREGPGGQIAVRHLDGRLPGQVPWQQAVLEGECGGTLAGEAARVVDADGGAAGEFLGEQGVVVGVVVRVGHADADRDAEGGAPRAQRHREHRVDALAVRTAFRGAGVTVRDPADEVGFACLAAYRTPLAQGTRGR